MAGMVSRTGQAVAMNGHSHGRRGGRSRARERGAYLMASRPRTQHI